MKKMDIAHHIEKYSICKFFQECEEEKIEHSQILSWVTLYLMRNISKKIFLLLYIFIFVIFFYFDSFRAFLSNRCLTSLKPLFQFFLFISLELYRFRHLCTLSSPSSYLYFLYFIKFV